MIFWIWWNTGQHQSKIVTSGELTSQGMPAQSMSSFESQLQSVTAAAVAHSAQLAQHAGTALMLSHWDGCAIRSPISLEVRGWDSNVIVGIIPSVPLCVHQTSSKHYLISASGLHQSCSVQDAFRRLFGFESIARVSSWFFHFKKRRPNCFRLKLLCWVHSVLHT